MGKKSGRNVQPNAPELQQMLLTADTINQPAHNPYYPDLTTVSSRTQLPPPPYSDLTTPMTNTSVPMGYIQHHQGAGDVPRQAAPRGASTSVVINRPGIDFDVRTYKYHKKVRRFNNEVFLFGLLSAVLAICAYKQYEARNCITEFTVHKPNPDLTVTIGNVRDFHVLVFYASIVVMLMSLVKCMFGECRSYSCYLLVMALISLAGTMLTGYIAWLAFYSPCDNTVSSILSNTVKTITSKIADNIPSPDKAVFGESNILQTFKDGRDLPGMIIFLIDAFNFILYLSMFISTTLLC